MLGSNPHPWFHQLGQPLGTMTAAIDAGARTGKAQLRSAEAPCQPAGGLRSAQERAMRDGNQNDRVDARNLAELLRTNQVHAVYHGKHGTRTLKELGRSYLTLTKDSTRVMNRIKSVY